MADQDVHVSSSSGRYRVAYEMALMMWRQSKGSLPNIENRKEFLELVSDCTTALAYRSG